MTRSRLRLDRFDLAVLVALAGLSLVVLAALLTKGRPLSGADGLLAADQLQYFAWIREASHHVLIGNRFDLAPGSRSFLHPGFGISGALHALSYLLWKPVAVGVTFVGARAYVRRLIDDPSRRRVALVLALFAVMPVSWIVAWTAWGGNPRQYTFDFISGEMWSGQYLWGYLMTAIAVFTMPLVLLWRERGLLGRAGAGALLVCWLQPWQGATLAVIVVATDLLHRRDRPSLRAGAPSAGRPWIALGSAAVVAGVAIPAAYYFALGHYDPAWRLAGESNAAGAFPEWSWPWWAILLTLAPLALPAALALRRPALTWQEVAVRVWPFAAIVVYLLPLGTFPYHSFQGLAVPLSILAVQGWPGRPRLAVVVGLVALMTLPGIAHKLEVSIHSIHAAGDPFWVFPGEVRALKWIESDPRPGGVLAPTYSGYMIPSRTGRETYVGALSWTPQWKQREREADGLAEGRVTGAAARALVLRTHARFVFVDCRPGLRDLQPDLAPLLEQTQRFGCASVYVLRERPGMSAVGTPDA